MTTPIDNMTIDAFQRVNQSNFRVSTDAGVVELQLAEVSSLGAPFEEGRRESFSLLFKAAASPALTQQIHTLEHAELGRVELFLVPVGLDPDKHACYEAVFN